MLCNSALYASDNVKEAKNTYSKEQVAKQNILTLFRWAEDGNLLKIEVGKAIAVIKEQLKVLKNEAVSCKTSYSQAYGFLDVSFFNTLAGGYEFESNNRSLLNSLFTEAVKKVEPNKDTPEEKPQHPWLDIKNNLVDCLTNEVIISFPKTTKTDLTKPEIFVAPEVTSAVDLVGNNLKSILNTELNLSGTYRFIHSGSTSRGTSIDNTDFDFELSFENQEDFDLFLGKIDLIVNVLIKEWRSAGYKVISADFSRNINSMKLLAFILQDKEGIVFRVHITSGKNMRIYPDILNAQIEQIKALKGSWEYVSGQIILFKRLVRDVLHSYGKWYGGLDGIRCEQFIIQAASSSDYGKTITGIGSFDKTMHWIYSIGFDRNSSAVIPFEIATKQVGIYKYADKYQKIECLSTFWDKLVNAARKYVLLAKIKMSENEFASLGY